MSYKPGYKQFIETYFQIVNKENKLVPFKLNKIQNAYLQRGTGKDLILKARQEGLSSLILAIFAVDFLMKENTWQIIVADEVGNATDLLDRVKLYIESYEMAKTKQIGKPFKIPMKYNSKNELYNEVLRSRFTIGTAGRTSFGRSKTVTNLHLSEAAYYPDLDSIITGVGQAVTPDGRMIFETTANGFNNFKELWDRSDAGKTEFKPIFFNAQDFYPKEFLEKKKKTLGRKYQQEYPNSPEQAFITSGDSYFELKALEYYIKFTRDKKPLKVDNDFMRYRKLNSGEFMVMGVDTAGGMGDFTVLQAMSVDRLDIPIVFQAKISISEATPLIYNFLEQVYQETGIPPVVTYERNNGGVFELERLKRLNKQAHYRIALMPRVGNVENKDPSILGFSTNTMTRPKILQELKEAVDNQLVKIYHQPTIKEMYAFVNKQRGSRWKAEAENGAHDDLCFIKDTMITTDKGQIPIQNIKPGDFVMTRKGLKEVEYTSQRIKQVITRFGLTGTPDHPVITKKGVKMLANLKASDIIYIWNEKQSFIKEKSIIDTQVQKGDNTKSIFGDTTSGKNHQLHFIDKFGLTILERFLKDVLFIIKIIIFLIIIPIIWSFLLVLSTLNFICRSQKEEDSQEKLVKNRQKELNNHLKSGEKKIQKKQGLFILKVGKHKLKGLQKSYQIGKETIQKKLENLLNKTQSIYFMSRLKKGFVLIAGKSSSILANGVESFAQENVPVNLITRKDVVYNLQIKDSHEYFANNILVHNCMALAITYFLYQNEPKPLNDNAIENLISQLPKEVI